MFQPRNVHDAFLASDGHINTLAEAVKDGGVDVFDPLLVWWSGQAWYVIDGHHRLDAIRQAHDDRPKLGITDVPVKVFSGSLDDAIAQSVARNSKDKLPMKQADKLESAWRLIALNSAMTKDQLRDVTSVSLRTIANMRKKRRELVDQGLDPMGLSWLDVKAGQNSQNPDEGWIERQARDWMEKLVKAFGKKLREQPEIAARMLELYSETLPRELVRFWPDEVQSEADDLRELEF
ncbi:MAG: ParB N-terminal domain-containing protein [Pseudomonadota bacterium]